VYGAGGGGGTGGASGSLPGGASAAGAQGVIVITYTPLTGGGASITSLYDGYDPVQEQGSATANLQIGLGTDERFTRTKSGVTSTYLTDLLGSTVALADSSGAVATTYSYDPYGVTTTGGAANDNQYQFTGRQNDGFGLYYYRARYYNPVWGRFVSEDPIGLGAGINFYAYVWGDPISRGDPMGLYASDSGGEGSHGSQPCRQSGSDNQNSPVILAGPRTPQVPCQNVECGALNGGLYYPLCPSCNDRLKKGYGPIILENGQVVYDPFPPYVGPIKK